MEQIVRDVRISQIYEGTNGVQALDLVSRKVLRDGGAVMRRFIDEMRSACEQVPERFTAPLHAALDRLVRVTSRVVEDGAEDPEFPGAASTDYLELTGLVIYAWLWARMAQVSDEPAKSQLADFFYAKLLPKTAALESTIDAGASALMSMPEESF